MTQKNLRQHLLEEVNWAARRIVTPEVADMLKSEQITIEELAMKFMMSLVNSARERTDWPQENKR